MWRYRWLAIICAWVVAVGGGIVVMSLPNRYEASARVYVDTESVLRPLLAGMAVQPNMDQLLTMMSRTLISRPNMEKVIRMADMEIRLKTPDDRERMIDQLIKGLAIKSAGRENLYTISYSDRNPQEAKRIVQSVLTLFVESSLGDKRKDNDSARRFLDEQLKTYAEKLAASENAVTEFKRKRMGLMPGDGGNFYTRLGEAKAQLEGATLALKEAENSRDALKLQVSGSGEMPPDLLGERGVSEDVNPELDARIQEMLKKLDSLRLTYTELHPDIVALTRSIAQLKEQKQREAKLRKPAPNVAQTQTPFYQQMGMALASAESNVAAMKARVQEYERRYAAVKATANSIPRPKPSTRSSRGTTK
jgi:polysaccharide chain length determinant protein (PEP-CTERM system associated)